MFSEDGLERLFVLCSKEQKKKNANVWIAKRSQTIKQNFLNNFFIFRHFFDIDCEISITTQVTPSLIRQSQGKPRLSTANGLCEYSCVLSHDKSWSWTLRGWRMDADHEN